MAKGRTRFAGRSFVFGGTKKPLPGDRLLKILFHNQMTKNKVGAIITERRCKVLQMIGVEYEMVYEIWYLEKDIDDTGGNLLRHIFNQRCCLPDDIQ